MTREELKEQTYWDKRRIDEDGLIEKKCTACDEWKIETEEFYLKNKSIPEIGFQPECKKCSGIRSMKYQNKHPEQYSRNRKRWLANNEEKDIKQKKIWHSTNKEKGQESYKKFVENNPDRVREYGQKHRLKSHTISKQEWLSCKDYFKDEDGEWACAYCGLKAKDHFKLYGGELKLQDLHKEHVDDKGANDLSNCIPSCHLCNSNKHTAKLECWYNKDNPCFTMERYDKIIKWITIDYLNISKSH